MVVEHKGKQIEVADGERRECEIYTRVMGYYRRTVDMNIGKRQEHRDRKLYQEPQAMRHVG